MTKAWIFHKFFTSKKICMYSVLKIYNVCGGRIVLEGLKSCGGCRRSSTLRLIEVKVLHKMFALYWRCLKISSFSKPGLLLLELWRHSRQWVCAKYLKIYFDIASNCLRLWKEKDMFLPEKLVCSFCNRKRFYICA